MIIYTFYLKAVLMALLLLVVMIGFVFVLHYADKADKERFGDDEDEQERID